MLERQVSPANVDAGLHAECMFCFRHVFFKQFCRCCSDDTAVIVMCACSSSAGFDASDRETPDTPLPNLLYIPAASPKKQTATDTLPQPAKVPAASELDLMTASIPADLKREEWRLDEFVAEQELHRGYASRVYKVGVMLEPQYQILPAQC